MYIPVCTKVVHLGGKRLTNGAMIFISGTCRTWVGSHSSIVFVLSWLSGSVQFSSISLRRSWSLDRFFPPNSGRGKFWPHLFLELNNTQYFQPPDLRIKNNNSALIKTLTKNWPDEHGLVSEIDLSLYFSGDQWTSCHLVWYQSTPPWQWQEEECFANSIISFLYRFLLEKSRNFTVSLVFPPERFIWQYFVDILIQPKFMFYNRFATIPVVVAGSVIW